VQNAKQANGRGKDSTGGHENCVVAIFNEKKCIRSLSYRIDDEFPRD